MFLTFNAKSFVYKNQFYYTGELILLEDKIIYVALKNSIYQKETFYIFSELLKEIGVDLPIYLSINESTEAVYCFQYGTISDEYVQERITSFNSTESFTSKLCRVFKKKKSKIELALYLEKIEDFIYKKTEYIGCFPLKVKDKLLYVSMSGYDTKQPPRIDGQIKRFNKEVLNKIGFDFNEELRMEFGKNFQDGDFEEINKQIPLDLPFPCALFIFCILKESDYRELLMQYPVTELKEDLVKLGFDVSEIEDNPNI